MKIFLEKNYRSVVIVIISFFAIISLLNAKNDSATFDEVAHIPAGYSYLSENDMRLNPEHPPLIKDLSAIPLMFLDINFDTSQKFWTDDVNGQWDAGRSLLYQSGNDPDLIIFWARVPIIIISVLLGLFIFKWVKEMLGTIPALFALTLYSFDPNILGHNHYVTTDIGIAAFITFSFYYFIKFIKKPTWRNMTIGGIFLGLVHLAKFSSVIMLPIFGLVLVIYPLFKKIAPTKGRKRRGILENQRLRLFFEYLGKGILAFIISVIMIWIVYIPNTYKMPEASLEKTIDFYFEESDTNQKTIASREILHNLNNSSLTRPLGEYMLGLFMVFKRVAGGNGAYFMQQVSSTAFPLYFPTVFLLKETIPFILLTGFALIYALSKLIRNAFTGTKNIWKYNWERAKEYAQNGVTYYTLLGFVALYSYLSVTGNLNIGFRHLFPIFPFLYILITKKVFEFVKERHRITHKTVVIIFSLAIICHMTTTIVSYPYYMSYFNPIAGGPSNGYKYVTDSNADWGQDLKRLEKYLDQHPEINKIRVDYFGGGDIFHYVGKDRAILWWDSKRPIEPGWYAISTNFIMGSIYDKEKKDEDSYRWLENYTPVDQVGTSILIYKIDIVK